MTNVSEDIIEKLTKILRLATDKGATAGEVEAAMGKAKEIAIRHNLDLASIDLNTDTGRKTEIKIDRADIKIRSKNEQKYHRPIYAVMMECFGVRVITLSFGGVCFVGETVDVLICKQLFPWL